MLARVLALAVVLLLTACYDFGRLGRLHDLAGDHDQGGDLAQALCVGVLPPGNLLPISLADPGGSNGDGWQPSGGPCLSDAGVCFASTVSTIEDTCIGQSPSLHICSSGLTNRPEGIEAVLPCPLTTADYVFEAWVRINQPNVDSIALTSKNTPFQSASVVTSEWQPIESTATLTAGSTADVALVLADAATDGPPAGCFDFAVAWYGPKATQ